MHFAATGAPTRFSMTAATSRVRGRPTNASIRSPIFTCVDALAAARFTRTWPPRQAAVASERVLKIRTDHSHTSTRVLSIWASCQPRPPAARAGLCDSVQIQMADAFVGHASVTINAPRAKVWDALVNPDTIMQYMPVTTVVSEWEEGSPIVWTSEFQGKRFEVKGTILRLQPNRLLEYDHSLPIFRASGRGHSSASYQRVTIELRDEGAQTHISVTE